MSDCGCEVQIDVPAWVPGAIAFGLFVFVAIAVIIVYILDEMERYRNFYGREDKLSSREQPAELKKKEEMDALALGRCSDEVLVIKSPPVKTTAPGTVHSGVKVMLRKKRIITKTPSKPLTTSLPTSMEPISPNIFNVTVIYDKTGRAFELIDLLQKEPPIYGSRTKKADALLSQVRNRLETMTGHSFIVYGLLMDSKWMVKGLENLGEAIEEMQLQLRLNVDSIGLKIFAYKIQACSADNALLMSMRARTSDALRPEPTQATPGSRWMIARRGSTPDYTPHMTPVPSRGKSAEIDAHDRRSKELLLTAAKNLRQAIASPSVQLSSPTKLSTLNSLDKRSVTRKSQTGTVKTLMKRSFIQTRSKEPSKERHHRPNRAFETTPTRKLLESKERMLPQSPGNALMMPLHEDKGGKTEKAAVEEGHQVTRKTQSLMNDTDVKSKGKPPKPDQITL